VITIYGGILLLAGSAIAYAGFSALYYGRHRLSPHVGFGYIVISCLTVWHGFHLILK
jgi:hypothetical protein